MNRTIDLEDKTAFPANKIHDVFSNRELSSEPNARKPFSQCCPKEPFGGSRLFSQHMDAVE